MIDRVLATLRQAGSVARPDLLRVLWEAGLLRPESPASVARLLPHLAARGPHLGVAYMLHARAQPDRPAITDALGSLTWKQLNERATRIGRGFRRRGGQPGEKVAFMLPGGRELAECLGATQKAALWAVPLSTSLGVGELRAVLAGQSPRVLVYDSSVSKIVAEAIDGLEPRPSLVAVGTGEHVRGSSAYEEVLAGADRHEFRARPVEQPGVVLWSGGRAVERESARALAGALGFLRAVPLRRRETALIAADAAEPLPFGIFALSLVLGSRVVFPPRPSAADLLLAMDDEAVTAAVVDPGILRSMVELPDKVIRDFDRSLLQIVVSYGAPLDADVRRRASNLFGPVLYDVFGTTEAGWVTVARPEDYDRKPSSVGKPIPGVTVTVRSPEGRGLPSGVEGRVAVSSDLAFAGYSDADDEVFTGREGWLDDEGYLFLS